MYYDQIVNFSVEIPYLDCWVGVLYFCRIHLIEIQVNAVGMFEKLSKSTQKSEK
jgi:hypothetical protein